MGNKVFFLIYKSSATKPFNPEELVLLLKKSRENNSKTGVTGMLLHKDGKFMQLLEGPEKTVRSIFAKIRGDLRHNDPVVLLEGETDERQFAEWSMGFCDLNSIDVRSIYGYSNFLNTPLDGSEFVSSPTRSQRLLLSFKKAV